MQHPEEQFDALRRALKLKHHEQPPPGYFRNFSVQVIGRIRHNNVHDRARKLDEAAWEAPWLSRVLDFFQGRPAYAGVFGAVACVLVLGGLILSDRPASPMAGENTARLGTPQNIAGVGLLNNPTESPLLGSSAGPLGALPPGTTLFDKMRPFQSAPAFSTTNLLK